MHRNKCKVRTLIRVGWAIAGAGLLVGVAGCPPAKPLAPVTDSVPAETAIARVNRNARGMNFLLRAGGVSASGQVVRADGKRESFDAHGTMYFRRPHYLYMELKNSLAGKIEIGSNDDEFWYWERMANTRYFTGHHATMAKPWQTDVPLRPDQFLDMLGLHELPTRTGEPGGPVFAVRKEQYVLDFYDKDDAGHGYLAKEVAISRRPPFLVSGITYYNPEKRPWMRADLLDYRPIEGTMVLAPRRIEVRSLEDASRLTVEFDNLRPSENRQVEEKRIARSPLQRGEKDIGEIIRMDRSSSPQARQQSVPPAAAER